MAAEVPAYKLPAEVNLIGIVFYLEALEWQRNGESTRHIRW